MSIIKSEDSKKWITALVVIAAVLAGFVAATFIRQLGDWFDLEAKISSFSLITQAVGVVTGFGTFIYILKNEKTSSYLEEVYNELVKVVWPTKDTIVKMTIGIAIALVIVAAIFMSVDFIFQKVLEFLY